MLQPGHLVGTGFFRDCDEQVGQVDLLRGRVVDRALLLGQVTVNVGIGDAHAGFHLALVQALQDELVAQLAAELGRCHAVPRHPLAQLRHRDLVLPSNGLLGGVHGVDLDAYPLVGCHLQLCTLINQPLQHTPTQFVLRRQALALGLRITCDACHGSRDVAVGDGVGIDHGHDVVCGLVALRQRRQRHGTGQ